MSEQRTDKELAFLHDLYVATDWGERFAELVDEHVTLPKRGRALYVEAGTGGHALLLAGRAGAEVTLLGTDESAARLELARAKATATGLDARAEFRAGQLESLGFEDEQFELVIGDASLVAPERLPEMLAELARVAAPQGTVALMLPTASSFGEFFSIYWESLANAGLAEHAAVVEILIKEMPIVSDVETLAAREGLDNVRSWTNHEEFSFASGAEFTQSPLVRNFLAPGWLEQFDDEARERVFREVERLIDEERQDAAFILSIKATLLIGQKAE